MFHIILHQPEIPPNTGNIVRLAANTGAVLHLVEPLGFSLSEKALRRAGMDYAEFAQVRRHEDWRACRLALGESRLFALTTKATLSYDGQRYRAGDAFLFGSEGSGLPEDVIGDSAADRRLRLPMVPGSRSLNLSNAVAAVVFEAWRQIGFPGSA
ncbi:MAG TPA: tRNA (cytidine(34)-2'-O)-methyltransferase [Rhodocyclaceae bacterium]|nr:tRNA (cytidine(34)-2'-O)-methyltransferase [Rhodocyclaceae bacterium]